MFHLEARVCGDEDGSVGGSAQTKSAVHRGDENRNRSMRPWSRALKGVLVKPAHLRA